MSGDRDPVRIVAKVLKRLYPQNPDVVLGREARLIVEAIRAAGLGFVQPIVECQLNPSWCELGDGHEGGCLPANVDNGPPKLRAEVGGHVRADGWECVCGESERAADETQASLGLYFHRRRAHA